MLRKKAELFWRIGFLILYVMTCFFAAGCSNTVQNETQVFKPEREVQASIQNDQETSEGWIKICRDLYETAEEKKEWSDLDVVREIVNRLGENGYTAVDSRNQVNMTCAEQAVEFCERAAAGEADQLTLMEVTDSCGLSIYDLRTKGKALEVVREDYQYQNRKWRKLDTAAYQTEQWQYTKDGYFMFSGVWFSEELYALTLGGTEEAVAFRVQPLDEACRERNRQYLFPIGYERNNMFLTNWDETDFGELDFYDLYDMLYPKVDARIIPYTLDQSFDAGTIYWIPEEDFERVIMRYFKIDRESLWLKTTYDRNKKAYEYRPRGIYETEYPEYPYPEVTKVVENKDGTITLTVHVVFPYAGSSNVFTHETVVRPMEDGGVQYVSNRVISSEKNGKATWHTPRLEEKQWKIRYGGQE